MHMFTRTKHISHLVSGKNCRRRGRNMPVVPNRPQPPSRHLPWGGGTAGPTTRPAPPGRSSSSGRRRVPLGPPFARLCCGNHTGSRADTHRHERRERERGEPGRRELRSAEAAPSPPPRSCAAPASPARRRAGRGGASAGREGSRAPGPPVGGAPQARALHRITETRGGV